MTQLSGATVVTALTVALMIGVMVNMNGRKAKEIRRRAALKVYEWYKTLVSEEEVDQLTLELALEFTPDVSYVYIETDSYKKPDSKIIVVSENTVRWFILQEKKVYDNIQSRKRNRW